MRSRFISSRDYLLPLCLNLLVANDAHRADESPLTFRWP
jgi:hypothetical protein